MTSYVPSAARLKIGHITPSSNTVVEPMTVLMSREYDDRVSHHFARIKVEAISLDPKHTSQFDAEAMLAAAELLADAAVDAIVWNGTSGGWNGIAADQQLCALISERTGIPTSTTTLAQLELLQRTGFGRAGLAVPYTDDVTARIVETLRGAGVEICGVANASVSDNREMAHVSETTTRSLVQDADRPEAECILLYCTGVAGAHLVEDLEQDLGKPVFDSVAVSLWKGLELVGIASQLTGWGSLMAGTAGAMALRAAGL
jgi:maleate isomerase